MEESYCLFYANDDDPILWPETIMQNQTVSGDIDLRLHALDTSAPDPDAQSELEGHIMNLSEYVFEIDGVEFSNGLPCKDMDDTQCPYPFVGARLQTYFYSNGPHTVRVKQTDLQGNEFWSVPFTLIFDNDISDISMAASNPDSAEEIDLTTNDTMAISATLSTSQDWRVVGYDYDPNAANGGFTNEMIITQGTGTTISCSWDGRLPGYTDDEARSDLVYVSIQTASDGFTVDAGRGKFVSVKPFPDNLIKVLCFTGKPNITPWQQDAMGVYPFRSYIFWKNANRFGHKARRLGVTTSTWKRISAIIKAGNVRMLYGYTHAKAGRIIIQATGARIPVTQIQLTDGTVLSRRVVQTGSTVPFGAGNFEDLNISETNQILFAFFDGCYTGYNNGSTSNPPFVPGGRHHDMAWALGMYHYTSEPKAYLGWYEETSADNNTSNFVGKNTNKPLGLCDLWTNAGSGRVLSYVIGNYPNGYTCPYILYSANLPPASWTAIYHNLRVFGSGPSGDNLGMNDRDFGGF
jgi:hypothetical protein